MKLCQVRVDSSRYNRADTTSPLSSHNAWLRIVQQAVRCGAPKLVAVRTPIFGIPIVAWESNAWLKQHRENLVTESMFQIYANLSSQDIPSFDGVPRRNYRMPFGRPE